MGKFSKAIPIAFLLALGLNKGALGNFEVKDNHHDARFLFRLFSDADLSNNDGFFLKAGGRTPIDLYVRHSLSAGDTELFLVELSDYKYGVEPISRQNNFEISLNPSSVTVGDRIIVYEGTPIYERPIDIFMDYINRTNIPFRFDCPREIAKTAKKVVLRKPSGLEEYDVSKRGKDYFEVEIPFSIEKEGYYSGLEILVNHGGGLRRADVSLKSNVFVESNITYANFKVTSNRKTMNVKTYFSEPGKIGLEELSEVYFIRNPGREISPDELDDFFFENPAKVPPGEYIVEAKRSGKLYRMNYNIPSAGKYPDYELTNPKDLLDTKNFDGECNLILEPFNSVQSSLYQELRKQIVKDIYSEGIKVGPEGFSRDLPIIFQGNQYVLGYDFSRTPNSLSFSWRVNENRATLFDLTKDEIYEMAKIETLGDGTRIDKFEISRISRIGGLRLSLKGFLYIPYVSDPPGYVRRDPGIIFEKRNFFFTLNVSQENQSADISRYFE